jgi:hypothetical protein
VLYVLYTDDSILAGKDLGETDESTTKYWNTEMGCGDGALANIWHEVSMMSPTWFCQEKDIIQDQDDRIPSEWRLLHQWRQ